MTIPYLTIAAVTAIPTLIFLAGVGYKKWAKKREERETQEAAWAAYDTFAQLDGIFQELIAFNYPEASKVLHSENFDGYPWLPVFPTGKETELRSQVYSNYFRVLEGQPIERFKTTGKEVNINEAPQGYSWVNLFQDLETEFYELAHEMVEQFDDIAKNPYHMDVCFTHFWQDDCTPGSEKLHQLFSTLRSRTQKKLEEEAEVASDNFFDQFPEDDEPEDGFVLIQGDEEPSPGAIAEELGEQKLSQKQLVAATLELFSRLFPLEQFRTMRLSHNSVKAQMQYNLHRYLAGNPQAIAHPEETIERIVTDYIRLHSDPRAKAVFIDLLNTTYAQSQVLLADSPDQPVFSFDTWISGEMFAGHLFSLIDDLDLTNHILYNILDDSPTAACAVLASSLDPVLLLASQNGEVPELFGLASCNDLMDAMYSHYGNEKELVKEMAAIAPPTLSQFLELLRYDRFFYRPFSPELKATKAAVTQLKSASPEWNEFFESVHELILHAITKLFNDQANNSTPLGGRDLNVSIFELVTAMQVKLDEQNARSQPVETENHQEEQSDHPAIAHVDLIFQGYKPTEGSSWLLDAKTAEMYSFLHSAKDLHTGFTCDKNAQGSLVVEVDIPEPNLGKFFHLMKEMEESEDINDDYDELLTVHISVSDQEDITGTLPDMRERFPDPKNSLIFFKLFFLDLHTFSEQHEGDVEYESTDGLKSLADFSNFFQDNYPEEYGAGLTAFRSSEHDCANSCLFYLPEGKVSEFFNRLHEVYPHFDNSTKVSLPGHESGIETGTLPELREFFR
jgi:hypothetical protein